MARYTIDLPTDFRWAKFIEVHPCSSIFHDKEWLCWCNRGMYSHHCNNLVDSLR